VLSPQQYASAEVVSPHVCRLLVLTDAQVVSSTVTSTPVLAMPDVAVIVVVPLATAVTRPEEDTVATDADDELHVTLAPLIVAPFWSLTVAVSCSVAPKDEKLRLVADSVIDVANDGAPCNFPVVGLSHATSSSRAVSPM